MIVRVGLVQATRGFAANGQKHARCQRIRLLNLLVILIMFGVEPPLGQHIERGVIASGLAQVILIAGSSVMQMRKLYACTSLSPWPTRWDKSFAPTYGNSPDDGSFSLTYGDTVAGRNWWNGRTCTPLNVSP